MTSFVDVDNDNTGICIHPATRCVRFLSFDDNGSHILADIELSRPDVERMRDTLAGWLNNTPEET